MTTVYQQYGRLKLSLYVNHAKPDEETGRLRGRWCTLRTWWIERSQVDATLVEFIEANPGLSAIRPEFEVVFTINEFHHM